ncbi:MAG: PLP-dependent transferase [Thermoplasmataceae archaeon]
MNDNTRYVSGKIEKQFGSLSFPIYQTSAYLMPLGERYRYSRESNPTVEALSERIANLEGAESGLSFSSGMGAVTTTLLAHLKPGSRIIVPRDLFARTYKFATSFLSRWNVSVRIVDPGSDNMISEIEKGADVVFFESITNPILRVNDIPAISRSAKKAGCMVMVDSTLATPVNQNPLALGADVVIHSASKFIAGHNDVIAGLAAGNEIAVQKVDDLRRTLGTSLDPNTAFLVMRGITTLKVRMDAINRSAFEVSRWISDHKLVSEVMYPGLADHPDHSFSGNILRGFGGVVSFRVKNAKGKEEKFMENLHHCIPANTLGGSQTTISHPFTMSHRGLSVEEKERIGITSDLFRLSVGLEDIADLMNDLDYAMRKIQD